jgi:hypothetical protein
MPLLLPDFVIRSNLLRKLRNNGRAVFEGRGHTSTHRTPSGQRSNQTQKPHGETRGDRDIPINSIASVEFVSPSWSNNGYIQFVLGGQEPRIGFWARSQDPYTVDFRYGKRTQFEELKQAIEQQTAMRQGPAEPPPASISPGSKEFEVEGKRGFWRGASRRCP